MILRPDHQLIADRIATNATVLDIGCGDGALLAWLAEHKQARARGIEIDSGKVAGAMARGVSVVQGDVNMDLRHYPDHAYDYVILSQTLQAMHDPKMVLGELVRIGRHAIVSLPNFGHWKNRLYLGLRGRMPVTRTLTYQWYDTPNIHFCTLSDFVELCDEMGITIQERLSVNHSGSPAVFEGKGPMANLFGEQGVFLLKAKG